MGRRRIHRRDLPERMYCDRGVYYLWPKGRPKHWFRDADGRPLSLAAALAEYGKLVDRPAVVVTIADLIDEFERSQAFAKLAERTQVDRRRHHAELRRVFGHYEPHELGQADVLEWKRARAPQAPRQWNQALSALKVLLGYAADPLGIITENPCREVKRMPEVRRTRAPSLAELEAFCALGNQQVRLYVALKLLTSLRMSDILRLTRAMILDDCLRVPIGKGGGRHTRLLFVDPESGESTGLRELLDQILALRRPVGSLALFCNRKGQAYTRDGWESNWQYQMRKFVAAGGERYHEHDIRARAGILAERQAGREAARQLLGHVEQRTTAIYTDRDDRIVVP
ncbi:tyrosine-type recombinase/integrase, partial [Luteitalea sp.]|uniref:tyrosine-type recombinase/integrase n=1 Tax=Luteitalea sp. TaxID=2004800 RepID=UPI0025C4C43F